MVALKAQIGGTVRHKTENNAVVLTFTGASLLKIISLMSGHLRTPKVYQFNKVINWFNTNRGFQLPVYEADTSALLNNAWLSGFIDADGSFKITVRVTSGKNRVESRFSLEQRMIDPYTGESYAVILGLIASTLKVKLNLSTHHGTKYYIVELTSMASRLVLVEYLNRFPLWTSKYLNYLDWEKCHDMMVAKLHTTTSGRAKAVLLKEGMNSKRTHYNWDHLQQLSNY